MDDIKPPPTFLVVDDDLMMRRMIRRYLEKQYPQSAINEAENGYDGEKMTNSLRPSVMIMDFNMPGLNGIRACNRIRHNPASVGTKIILITAEPTEELEKMALISGADAFVPKPFSHDVIMGTINRLLCQ